MRICRFGVSEFGVRRRVQDFLMSPSLTEIPVTFNFRMVFLGLWFWLFLVMKILCLCVFSSSFSPMSSKS